MYRAPFLEPASRRPMLVWTREFPLDGEPAEVAELVLDYGRWMAGTPDVPKLLMAMDNGVGLGSPEVIGWAAETFASAEVVWVGPGGHQAPEDQPDRIGTAVAEWLAQRVPAAVARVGASFRAIPAAGMIRVPSRYLTRSACPTSNLAARWG